MDIQERIMRAAVAHFNKELNDPTSDIHQKYMDMLFGNSNNSVFGRMTAYPAPGANANTTTSSGTNTTVPPGVNSNTVAGGNAQAAGEEEKLAAYKRNAGQIIGDNVLGVLSGVSKDAGDITKDTTSILGKALMNMSHNNNKIKNPVSPLLGAAGGALTGGGALIGGLSKLLGNALAAIHKDVVNNREKERETELLIREKPSGAFYDARRKLTTGVGGK